MRYRTFLLVCFVSLIGVEAVRADATTDYNLAIELYSQQRWQLAVESCEEFVNKYPTHARVPDARLYWAQSLVHLRQFAPAREQYVLYLKTAKPDHPDRALATYRAGECSYFLGDLKQAQDWLSRFLQSYPENNLEEWAIVYLGETDFRLNQFSEAKEAFEQSLNKYPNGRLVEDARYGLGRTLVRLGQTDQAIITFEEVASKKESRRAPEAMFAIGSTYFDSGEFREAAKAFAQLLEDYPSSSLVSTAKLNAGYAHFSLKAYQTAITLFEEAAQDPEQALTAIYWKGLSEKGLLDYAKAVTTFADSLEKAPTQPLAENLTYQWGDAEFRLANYDKAVTLLKSVFEKWPQGEYADDALHLATEAAFQRKDLPLARQLHQQFITQYPKSPLVNVQNLLSGRILVASGDQAKSEAEQRPFYLQALGVFEQVESRSNAPETRRQALFQLARTNERLGNDADVVTQLGRLLSAEAELSRSERYDAHLLRANASLRQGSAAEARQDYQRCQDLAESDEEQRQALTGLAGTQTSLLEWESLLATLTQLKALDSENQQLPRVAVAAGDAAYDAQLWDVADQIYAFVQSLPEDHPFAIPARSGAAHTTYELGRFEKSAELFQAIGRTPGIDLELRSHCAYMVALSLRQAGRLDESLEQFEITAKAFQRESAPETNEQLAACRNAYRSAKGGARVARELMKTEQADRLYESAFQQLKLLPAKEQKELDLLINEWADLSYNAKDFSRSDELYRLLLKERPDSDLADEARLILAESLRFDGNLTAAQDEFQKLFLDPRSDEFVRQRAVVHLLDLLAESKDWGASLELSEKVLGEFPQSEHRLYTEYRRGEALLQLKKTDEAIQQLTRLKEALANDLGSAPAWWPETWLLLAEAQFLKKDYSSMDETLGDLNVLGDGLPVLYRAEALRGRSLESRARFDEAREAYQRVIDSPAGKGTETAAEAQFRIAESYLKQNNLPTALKEYIKVFVGYDAPRFQSAALYQAGSVDATLKNWREAATTFRTLIEKFPESDFATQAQSELEKIETAFPELKMES